MSTASVDAYPPLPLIIDTQRLLSLQHTRHTDRLKEEFANIRFESDNCDPESCSALFLTPDCIAFKLVATGEVINIVVFYTLLMSILQ